MKDEHGIGSWLNPEYVCRGLLRWKDKELAQHGSHKSWGKRRMVGLSVREYPKEVI